MMSYYKVNLPPSCIPPRWPNGKGVCLESGRSRVRIRLAAGFFWGSSHTSDLKIGTPVATLPGDWHYRVSAGTGQPSVSILWLGEVESLICNFYRSVAARKIVQIRPWDTLACCWDVKQPTNKQTFLHTFHRLWLQIVIHVSCYTHLEAGNGFPHSSSMKQCWRQASWYHNTQFSAFSVSYNQIISLHTWKMVWTKTRNWIICTFKHPSQKESKWTIKVHISNTVRMVGRQVITK